MKFRNAALKFTAAVIGGVTVAVPAFATGTGPDFSALTLGVDLSSASAAVIAIAVAIAPFLVAKRGARGVLGMIGR